MLRTPYDLAYEVVDQNFDIEDVIETQRGLEFRVREPLESRAKESFQRVFDELSPHHLIPKLVSEDGWLRLIVFHFEPAKGKRSRIYLPFALITVATVTFAGYLNSRGILELVSQIGISFDVRLSSIIFALSVFCVLGVHELGHMLAMRSRKGGWELPLFIPAPPPLGTFGAIIHSRGVPVNRDEVFDLGISGPIAGIIASIPVLVIGLRNSFLIDQSIVLAWIQEGEVQTMPTTLLFLLLSRLVPVPGALGSGDKLLILDLTATIGLILTILTFVNLLPVSQTDGGHVFYSIWPNPRAIRVAGFISILVAFLISPFTRLMAVILAIFALRMRHPPPLDEVSPLSKKRKYIWGCLYLLALLMTAPIPY